MTDLLIFIRNLVLAAILGWLGIEFAPDKSDKDEKPAEPVAVLAVLG
ncbi:MAG: hypothetical protein RLO80_02960 [Hyphomonas sp.]